MKQPEAQFGPQVEFRYVMLADFLFLFSVLFLFSYTGRVWHLVDRVGLLEELWRSAHDLYFQQFSSISSCRLK